MEKNNPGYSGIAYGFVPHSLALAPIKILIIKYLILSLLSYYILRHHLTLYSYFISELPYQMHTYIASKHQPINQVLRTKILVWTQVRSS